MITGVLTQQRDRDSNLQKAKREVLIVWASLSFYLPILPDSYQVIFASKLSYGCWHKGRLSFSALPGAGSTLSITIFLVMALKKEMQSEGILEKEDLLKGKAAFAEQFKLKRRSQNDELYML